MIFPCFRLFVSHFVFFVMYLTFRGRLMCVHCRGWCTWTALHREPEKEISGAFVCAENSVHVSQLRSLSLCFFALRSMWRGVVYLYCLFQKGHSTSEHMILLLKIWFYFSSLFRARSFLAVLNTCAGICVCLVSFFSLGLSLALVLGFSRTARSTHVSRFTRAIPIIVRCAPCALQRFVALRCNGCGLSHVSMLKVLLCFSTPRTCWIRGKAIMFSFIAGVSLILFARGFSMSLVCTLSLYWLAHIEYLLVRKRCACAYVFASSREVLFLQETFFDRTCCVVPWM